MKPKPIRQLNTIARARQFASAGSIGIAMLTTSSALQAADSFKGKQLYTANCAICHGVTGKSAIPGAPNLNRGDGMLRPDFTLLAAIRSGKNAMPAFQGIMTDRDIMDVIAYMRTLH
jgi:cytochrome c6